MQNVIEVTGNIIVDGTFYPFIQALHRNIKYCGVVSYLDKIQPRKIENNTELEINTYTVGFKNDMQRCSYYCRTLSSMLYQHINYPKPIPEGQIENWRKQQARIKLCHTACLALAQGITERNLVVAYAALYEKSDSEAREAMVKFVSPEPEIETPVAKKPRKPRKKKSNEILNQEETQACQNSTDQESVPAESNQIQIPALVGTSSETQDSTEQKTLEN